jgi:fatty acid desaturase
MRRIVPVQKWTWIYRFQHLYLPVLYFLLAMKVRISDITDYFFLKKNGPIRVNWHPGIVARQIITKSLWVGWRMLLPIFILGAPAGHVMWYWFVSDLVTGGFLAYNFQVSHVVEDCEWPNGVPPTSAKKNSKKAAAVADKNVEMSWAENQIRTSVDYGHDSAVWTYLCGHLNYQIEHHLFPGVSQYHYPALAPIVKQTCKEFGLPYIYKPTFYEALMAHFGYLYNMGKAGKAVHMD